MPDGPGRAGLGLATGRSSGPLDFGGLDDQIDAAVVGEDLVQLEGEDITLALKVVRQRDYPSE